MTMMKVTTVVKVMRTRVKPSPVSRPALWTRIKYNKRTTTTDGRPIRLFLVGAPRRQLGTISFKEVATFDRQFEKLIVMV